MGLLILLWAGAVLGIGCDAAPPPVASPTAEHGTSAAPGSAPVSPAADVESGAAPANTASPSAADNTPHDAADNHATAEPHAPPAAPRHSATKPANRLARETSPYLLMHAHNPVDWYPWGKEALEKARRENKLIFLSVGYSSCYWCHVMERETFMNEAVADYLNKHFVCIKVDREELPDVDDLYMTALYVYNQLSGTPGGGGWPLSMFLTPDALPIGGGTYFPPHERRGRPGFLDVIGRLQEAWTQQEKAVRQQAEAIARAVRVELTERPALLTTPPGRETLDAIAEQLHEQFDARYGGFRYSEANPRVPKFPEPSNLLFLLARIRSWQGTGEPPQPVVRARNMLLTTLDHMARGGIRDHLGGGFHRYSTDRYWRVPHFEKMLYDNAQLATVYAEAYALTGNPEYRRVVQELLAFVQRELTHPAGGFYAALDAETDAEEGKFYVWSPEELQPFKDDPQWPLLAEVYALAGEPPFEGKYVLYQPQPPAEVAQRHGCSVDELYDRIGPLAARMFAARAQRQRPLTDTKILSGWNGLMIRGFADAGRILDNDEYRQAAARAARFVLQTLRTSEGHRLRSYAGGQARFPAYCEDYAFLVEGLLALHRATGDDAWLREAEALNRQQIDAFWDDKGGGCFFTAAEHDELFARTKGGADGALPAANSVTASNLVYLAAAQDKADYLRRAEQTVQAFAPLMQRAPQAMPRMGAALAQLLEARREQAPPSE
jgi:uncharacterized protein YyaL (SSP411 family)